MPLLRRVLPEEHRRPVILVGNRSDMLEVSSMEVRQSTYPIPSSTLNIPYTDRLFSVLKCILFCGLPNIVKNVSVVLTK